MARSVGSARGMRVAMLPTVLLPWSPYAAASGSSPIPTLSITMTIARRKTEVTPLLMGEIIRDGLRSSDEGDGVLEDEMIGPRLLQHEREAIEILDAPLDFGAVHHPDRDDEFFAPQVVEKDILDVGLRRFRRGGGRHFRIQISDCRFALSIARQAAAMVAGDSPGPSSHTRLGSLRNQINWRRAYRRFSCAMSSRVAGSSRTPCRCSSA